MPDLFDYQIRAAEVLAAHPRQYLADVQGLGKTREACHAALLLSQRQPLKKIRVLCPASAVSRWDEEWEAFGPQDVDVEIRSYDSLLRENSGGHKQDILILDEVHRLKVPSSKRTKTILGREGLFRRSQFVWALSGTPMPNHRPDELFTVLATLFPDRLREAGVTSFQQFVNTFCVQEEVWYRTARRPGVPSRHQRKVQVVTGIRNAERFKALLTGGAHPLLLRRTWESPEVLAEMAQMPPLVWRHELVDADLPTLTPEETALAAAWSKDLNRVQVTAPPAGSLLSSLRGKVGQAKVNVIADILVEELRAHPTEKRVVFAYHHDVLSRLAFALKEFRPVRVDGRLGKEGRDAAVRDFQTAPWCRVFLGQTDACKESLTLTAASQVEIIEPSFVPGDDEQATARIRRHGQTARHLLVRVWGLAGSYDGRIAKIRAQKLHMKAEIGL